MNREFCRRLKRLREKRGVSRRVLSELCGLDKDRVRLYEKGIRQPSAQALCELADYFGVTVDWLLGREK